MYKLLYIPTFILLFKLVNAFVPYSGYYECPCTDSEAIVYSRTPVCSGTILLNTEYTNNPCLGNNNPNIDLNKSYTCNSVIKNETMSWIPLICGVFVDSNYQITLCERNSYLCNGNPISSLYINNCACPITNSLNVRNESSKDDSSSDDNIPHYREDYVVSLVGGVLHIDCDCTAQIISSKDEDIIKIDGQKDLFIADSKTCNDDFYIILRLVSPSFDRTIRVDNQKSDYNFYECCPKYNIWTINLRDCHSKWNLLKSIGLYSGIGVGLVCIAIICIKLIGKHKVIDHNNNNFVELKEDKKSLLPDATDEDLEQSHMDPTLAHSNNNNTSIREEPRKGTYAVQVKETPEGVTYMLTIVLSCLCLICRVHCQLCTEAPTLHSALLHCSNNGECKLTSTVNIAGLTPGHTVCYQANPSEGTTAYPIKINLTLKSVTATYPLTKIDTLGSIDRAHVGRSYKSGRSNCHNVWWGFGDRCRSCKTVHHEQTNCCYKPQDFTEGFKGLHDGFSVGAKWTSDDKLWTSGYDQLSMELLPDSQIPFTAVAFTEQCYWGAWEEYRIVGLLSYWYPTQYFDVYKAEIASKCYIFDLAVITANNTVSKKDITVCVGSETEISENIKMIIPQNEIRNSLENILVINQYGRTWVVEKDSICSPGESTAGKIGNSHFWNHVYQTYEGWSYHPWRLYPPSLIDYGVCPIISNCDGNIKAYPGYGSFANINYSYLNNLNLTDSYSDLVIDMPHKKVTSLKEARSSPDLYLQLTEFTLQSMTWTDYTCQTLDISCIDFEGHDTYHELTYNCTCDTESNVPLYWEHDGTREQIDFLTCNNKPHTIKTVPLLEGTFSIRGVSQYMNCSRVMRELYITGSNYTTYTQDTSHENLAMTGVSIGSIVMIIVLVVVGLFIYRCLCYHHKTN